MQKILHFISQDSYLSGKTIEKRKRKKSGRTKLEKIHYKRNYFVFLLNNTVNVGLKKCNILIHLGSLSPFIHITAIQNTLQTSLDPADSTVRFLLGCLALVPTGVPVEH